MSNNTYQEILNETSVVLDKTLPQEQVLQEWAAKLKKIKNAREAHTTVYRLYATYITIVNNLEQCYDQMLQPQKRVVLRVLLDASIGRMLELKDELVNLDMSDVNYDDDALNQLRMSPGDLELRVPRYIAREREAERLQRKKFMDGIYLKLLPPEPAEEQQGKAEEELKEEETEEDELDLMLLDKQEKEPEVTKVKKVPISIPEAAPAENAAVEEKLPEVETIAVPVEEIEQEEAKVSKIRETPQHRREMFASREAERERVRQKIKKELEEKLMKTIREAIFVIQVHERARQARYNHQIAHTIAAMRAVEGQMRMTQEEKDQREQASIKIQRCWRLFRKKRKQRHRAEQKDQLLWMTRSSGPLNRTQYNRAQEVCRLRYGPQADFQEDYEYAEVREREEYRERHAPWLKDQYTDEIREWFREWYTKVSNFPPEYPKDEDGGSLMIVEGKYITPEEWKRKQEREEAEKKKKRKQQKPVKKTKEQIREEKKKAKELAAKLKKEEEKKRKQDERDNPGFKMNTSKYLPMLFNESEKYNELWRNRDESCNPEQKHYMDLIQQDKRLEVQLEVRKIVDELMRLELEHLKVAIEKDIARSKGKKWRPKKGKKKKKVKKHKKKGKKKADLTEDRTTESLIEELMEAGILVHPIPEIRVEQFIGDYNYTAYEKRLLMDDPVPAVGDIRNLVSQYCILPFGSPLIRQISPLVKAVCIVGPKDSGKHMLVSAICTETGAYLFDISPETIAGKYKGKDGTKMFDHLMNKMTRLLQPAIVFIDGAEKPFYKKVPKAERQFEPKRLARWLPKFAKRIKAEDQVMIIGTSHQPWAGSPKRFTKLYNKFIFIPRTDYGTTEAVWKEQIMRHHLVNRNFDISAIAKTTAGLSVGVIKYLVQKVLSRKRIIELPFKPLTPEEIFEASLKYQPVTEEEFKKFLDFFSKRTKLGKKRAKFMREYHSLQEKLTKVKNKKK